MCKVHIMIAGCMHPVSQLTFEGPRIERAKDFYVFLPGSKGAKSSRNRSG